MKTGGIEWFKIVRIDSGGFGFVPAFPKGETPLFASGGSSKAAASTPTTSCAGTDRAILRVEQDASASREGDAAGTSGACSG